MWPSKRVPAYRTITMTGRDVPGAHLPHPFDKELAIKMYSTMATLQARACRGACMQGAWRSCGFRCDGESQHPDSPGRGRMVPAVH